MKTRLVLFDFDFTLVDASGCLFNALRTGFRAMGINSTLTDDQLKPLIGIPLEEQFRLLSGDAQQDPKSFTDFKAAYIAARNALEAEGSGLLPGVMAGLQALQAKELTLGIVSTGATDRIRRTLIRCEVISYFNDNILGGASDKASVILNAIKYYNYQPEECIYIGDRPDDGLAAQCAGTKFIAVTTGAFTASDFPVGTMLINTIDELPELLEQKF